MIIANFKSNGSKEMIDYWIKDFKSQIQDNVASVGVAPPHIYIDKFYKSISQNDLENIKIGAQDVGAGSGPNTGSISSAMLSDLNCNFSIVGHSERRKNFKEDNALIKQKIENLISFKLTPVLCVGEKQ